ncbi:reverse transcriptase domain-containing protein [Tanacetum coccineum]|uniref:Reverse transcriptase domain-containing protein n=1 Tax=Tanacetum coccineum TaxID=301880 RepID=A0ABQ4WYJ9_9ASTR
MDRSTRALTMRKSVRPLPSHRLALRYTSHYLDGFTFKSASDHSSLDHSSSGHSTSNHSSSRHSSSDHSSCGHSTSGHSLSRHTPLVTTIADSSAPSRFVYPPLARTSRYSEAYLRWSSAPLSTMYPSMTFETSTGDSSSKSSTGPSRKRCSVDDDIDTDVLADIEADATAVEVATDIDVEAEVDAGISIEVDVGIDVEDDVEDEVESSDRGIIEVGVDVVDGIDIPDGMLMPDVVEHLEQRELEARSLIASGEKASLLDHVVSLERRNVRLQGTLMMESARSDRFQRRIGFMEKELRQIHRFRYYDIMRFRRLKTFAIMTITRSGMTPEAIEELINQRVVEDLAAYEANRVAKLVVESQSQNRDDDDNGNIRGNENKNGRGNGDRNGGGNGNGNGGGNGNGNPNQNDRSTMHVSHECTYHDFVKCQTLNFKGTNGVVRLTRWFEKMKTVFHITDAAFAMSWRELMKLMTEVYCPRNEIQKMESELWNLTMKYNNLASYTQRFQELTMLCTKMVPEEEDQVEKFIGGFLDNI